MRNYVRTILVNFVTCLDYVTKQKTDVADVDVPELKLRDTDQHMQDGSLDRLYHTDMGNLIPIWTITRSRREECKQLKEMQGQAAPHAVVPKPNASNL